MVCAQCSKASEKLKDSFTKLERVHLLAAASTLGGIIHRGSGRAKEEDRIINSSVVTKLILSLEPALRAPLLQQFREVSGAQITLDSCPHGSLVLV
jgi:hypothetical protein